jgi:hypothetical protein
VIPYQSSLSKEYVRVPISAREGSGAVNPTSRPVDLAFMPLGTNPASGDWVVAAWETDGSTYYARATVGPGGSKVLAAGTYTVWVRVQDSPEIPVRPAGLFRIV